MYAYCENNPVMRVDFNGDSWLSFLIVVVVCTVVFEFVVNTIVSDVPELEEEEEKYSVWTDEDGNIDFLYADPSVDTISGETSKIGLEVGLYNEDAKLNSINEINIDVAKASASIGYGGASAGLYAAEVTTSNTALNLFGHKIKLTFGVNFGIGGQMSLGKKSVFGYTLGVGFVFSFEVID